MVIGAHVADELFFLQSLQYILELLPPEVYELALQFDDGEFFALLAPVFHIPIQFL